MAGQVAAHQEYQCRAAELLGIAAELQHDRDAHRKECPQCAAGESCSLAARLFMRLAGVWAEMLGGAMSDVMVSAAEGAAALRRFSEAAAAGGARGPYAITEVGRL